MSIDVAFDLELPHGRCIAIRIPEAVEALADAEAVLLAPRERAFAERLSPVRRRTWVSGRAVLHEALRRAGLESMPAAVLPDDRGAPRVEAGLGSISHKRNLAVALVAPASGGRIGVDVEADEPGRQDISSIVLAEDEHEELRGFADSERAREVLLRFSAKESIYKALDPFVRRYVGFKEVSVATLPDGSAHVIARLRDGEGPFSMEVHWRRFDGVVLTTARVRPDPASLTD